MSFSAILRQRICSPTFAALLLPRFFSSIPHFKAEEYLISSFGFSPIKAATITKSIAHLKSTQKPDAVRHFLDQHGFDESEIKTIVTKNPSILCSNPEKTLAPNLRALRDIGLSASALNQIIFSDPAALQRSEAVPRINFWMDFVGGEEETLVKVFKRNRGLIRLDTSGGIATKMTILENYGISIQDIRWIVCTVHNFIIYSVGFIEELLQRVKELGFQPESKMFAHGLLAMVSVNREAMKKKKELFKSFGWSENEFLSAVRKAPTMLHLSKENLHAKMEFLPGEAKCDILYIAFRPLLLMFSLEKRLRPRYHVLRILESRNLTGKTKDFKSIMMLSDMKFVATYILPHKNVIPELNEVYSAELA